MAAGYQELFMEQGTDFATTITLNDVDGVAYDLIDVQVKGQIKKSYYSTTETATFTVNTNDAIDGVVILQLNNSVTSNIAPGRYVYDVIMKDSSNNITRILEGIVNVLPQVTVF